MYLVSSCSCLCLIHWSQVFRERRRSWSSTDRRCSNYIWVSSKLIACQGVTYITGLTILPQLPVKCNTCTTEMYVILQLCHCVTGNKRNSFLIHVDCWKHEVSKKVIKIRDALRNSKSVSITLTSQKHHSIWYHGQCNCCWTACSGWPRNDQSSTIVTLCEGYPPVSWHHHGNRTPWYLKSGGVDIAIRLFKPKSGITPDMGSVS